MSVSSARDEILRAVHAALPPAIAAPVGRYQREQPYLGDDDLVTRFSHSVVASGAVALRCNGDPVPHVNHAVADAREKLSLVSGVASTVAATSDPHALATLELFICQASVGVAENGALWFATSDSYHRAALFLAERVIIVVAADAIVADLHEAYRRINVRAAPYGSFIAGPSKTADIEQALVIGAHGPKELTVIITEPNA